MCGSIFFPSTLLVQCCFCCLGLIHASRLALVLRSCCPQAFPSVQPSSFSSPLTYCSPPCYHSLSLPTWPLFGVVGLVFVLLQLFCVRQNPRVRIHTNHFCFTCGLSSSCAVVLCCLIYLVSAASNWRLFESMLLLLPVFMYLSRNDQS